MWYYVDVYTERRKFMPVFTESKKGYNKDEVNNFIKQQNEANEAKLAEKDRKIKSLEDEIKKLSKNADSAPAKVEAPATAENTDLEEAKKRYERLCSDMGEKLLLAEVKASEVIEEANKKAEAIIAEARIAANEQVKKILEDSEKNAEGIKKAIAEYSAKEKEILALLNTTEETFKKALEKISANLYEG